MCLLDPLVTHQSQSPTWLSQRSKHRVWLKDVQLYVFCQRYRHEKMRQNKAGAFEIYFVSEEGKRRFSLHKFPEYTVKSYMSNLILSSGYSIQGRLRQHLYAGVVRGQRTTGWLNQTLATRR